MPEEITGTGSGASLSTGGGNVGTAASGTIGSVGGVYLAPDLANLFFEPVRWVVPFSDQWCQGFSNLMAAIVMAATGWLLGGGAGIIVGQMRKFQVVLKKKPVDSDPEE